MSGLLLASGANGEPWWISLIKAAIVINLVLVTFAYLTLAERKIMGRMQLRYGPNRAGPYGLLQPIADLVKLIRKESFFPAAAIDLPYIIAPIIAAFTALAAFAEVRERVIRNVEVLVRIPAVRLLRQADLVLAKRRTVRLLAVLLVRAAEPDVGADRDQARARVGQRGFDGRFDGGDVVAVGDLLGVPAVGVEALEPILRPGHGGRAV